MRVDGLPVGQGELWHDPAQKTVLLGLVAIALSPLLAALGPALGWMKLALFPGAVEPFLLALFVIASFYTASRSRALGTRVGVSVLVAGVGAVLYDGMLLGGRLLTPALNFPLMGSLPVVPGAWSAGVMHMLATAAAWAFAYAMLVGKARWYFGVAWSLTLWWAIALLSLLPHGPATVALTPGALTTLLGVHLVFGVALGALNHALQPELRGRGKILFLRDYVQVRQQR